MADAGLLFCYAETPVHAGGSDSVGVVDLPIQRESTTDLPTIWGQSAKGALRDHARELPAQWPGLERVFGSEPPNSSAADAAAGPPRPGWLAVGDLRLVAFPVPTLSRTFAWVTSPLALARLLRMARLAGAEGLPDVPTAVDGQVVPTSSSWGEAGTRIAVGEHDLELAASAPGLHGWARWLAAAALPLEPDYFRRKLERDLLLVSDDDLVALTREHAELLPRVQLETDAKTVRHGPWYTEYLPAETLLCGLL